MTAKRKFKFVEGKERVFVYTGILLVYIFILLLVAFVYINLQDKIWLEMKFDSEKAFNSVYMFLDDGKTSVENAMEDAGIYAVGLYSSTGMAVELFGSAPETLPVSRLAGARQSGSDSTTGIYFFVEGSDDIEYLRLSRFTAIPGASFTYNPTQAQSFLNYPEVIYVRFDGSAYSRQITQARILSIGSVVLLTVFMFYSLSIYNANRRYRIALTKHENLASLGAAARTLTHEIKNPLSAMTIQMVLLHKMLGKEYEQDLDVMDHEIERLTNLTNRVSEFIKDPVGNPQKLDLVPFLTSISGLFSVPIRLVFNGMDHCYVMFDEVRARSVFENLMKNASESTTDRNPDVEVEVSRGRKKSVEIEIRDRGDGLPKELTETLFDPFFTTKTKGSGIGLSISRQFVVAAEGKLSLESRNGGGTIARVVLPAVEEPV